MTTSLRLKTARLGAALALALAALPGTASATTTYTFNLGLNPNVALPVVHSADSFIDHFAFKLNPAGNVAAQGVSLNFAPFYNISGGSFQLYSGVIGSGSAMGGSTPLNNIPASYASLGAGDYYFNITGNANGTAGGGYLFSMVTAPVPEPDALALMLSGLGLIGVVMRRRLAPAS